MASPEDLGCQAQRLSGPANTSLTSRAIAERRLEPTSIAPSLCYGVAGIADLSRQSFQRRPMVQFLAVGVAGAFSRSSRQWSGRFCAIDYEYENTIHLLGFVSVCGGVNRQTCLVKLRRIKATPPSATGCLRKSDGITRPGYQPVSLRESEREQYARPRGRVGFYICDLNSHQWTAQYQANRRLFQWHGHYQPAGGDFVMMRLAVNNLDNRYER